MNNNPSEEESWAYDELRQLLLGPELKKLEQITDKLENPEQFSREIGDVLPQAMLKSAEHGEQLSEAMIPTVEEIVRLSIKRDINKFASALFPVIGPAIRKSIAETLRQMMQSPNQVLEHGLSWQGMKWRIESIRTGIPFAQIVMLNSLEF
ncbi:MAG: OmpA family protein, partial [Gammaproteobacteria bacterium]|nr:OmpA family protein [Gammaproteobacteria bacterium]